ncbi:MAG: phage tail protein [Raineya sp.]|jgi:phage tail-like protein|nr:phage tail protein [Raineya sp.]
MQGNPLNTFQFKLLIFGLNPLSEIEVQKVKTPTKEISEIEVGAGTETLKYPGKIKVGDLEIEKLKVSVVGAIDPIYQWFNDAQNYGFGSKSPLSYRKQGQLWLLAADMVTKLQVWEIKEIWPKKIEGSDLDLKANELYIDKVTFSVRRFEPVIINA